MTQKLTLSVHLAEAIEEHNMRLIDAAQNTLMRLRQIPVPMRDKSCEGQINYWVHAIAALKWSTVLARQRAGISLNGVKSTVQ